MLFINRIHQISIALISTIFISLIDTSVYAINVPIDDFSISPYSQATSDYLSPNGDDFSSPLLKPEYQKKQLQQFYTHYYASDANGLSPWSEQLINAILPVVKKTELEQLDLFNNQDKPLEKQHYGENFKAHDALWWNKIKQNIDLDALDSIHFTPQNRAIAVNNTMARGLPELAPDFYHASLPGEGFPFDNLQESAIWAGTPLYVLSTSKDKAWSLVLTPDAYFAWVSSHDIALVSNTFIHQWQEDARAGLVAITKTKSSIMNTQQQFEFSGYIGAVFPLVQSEEKWTSIAIPVKGKDNQAVIKTAIVRSNAISLMPLLATKKNFSKILEQLQHRPYGWGGAFLFNDCSQEIKSIFTPFGIWLPRNSGAQARVGTSIDLSEESVDERINTLTTKGAPLMTIIYIGSHVMLYVGNKMEHNSEKLPITYQNVWGFRGMSENKRYVIGESVFLPLRNHFPEQPDALSQASLPRFKLIYLNALDEKTESSSIFAKRFFS